MTNKGKNKKMRGTEKQIKVSMDIFFLKKKQRSIALLISFKHVVSCFTFHRERASPHLLVHNFIGFF